MDEPPRYSLKQRLLLALAPPLAACILRCLALSWRVRLICPPGTHPRGAAAPWVYAMWHEGILAVTAQFRGETVQGLASQSFDGELISRTMVNLGYPGLTRGSSSRGGAQALSAHVEALAQGRHVVITMDGPRGPRHEPKAGVATIAARSGRPLVPLHCEARPALRLRSWDRSLIPLPFAKVVFVMGAPVSVVESAVNEVLASLPQRMQELEARAKAELDNG